jgi:MFS family permease
MPVLPELGRIFGVSPASIALVVTLFTLPGVALTPAAGILADRYGRKIILVPSLLVFSVFGAACAFAQDFQTLLLLRFFQGAGVAPLGVLNMTMVGDLFSGTDRAKAMGYAASVLSIGTAAFPAVGGLLAALDWSYPFMLPAVAAPLALVVALFLDEPAKGEGEPFMSYLKSTARTLTSRRALGLFGICLLTFIILYGCFITYLPILLRMECGATPPVIGLIVSTASGLTALAASLSGRLSQKFSPVWLMRAAFVCYAASLALIPVVPGLWWRILPVTLFGLGQGLNVPNLLNMLTHLAPTSKRAAVMAVNGAVLRVGQTTGPLLMGAVFAGLGLAPVFLAGALIAGAMLVVLQCCVASTLSQGGAE